MDLNDKLKCYEELDLNCVIVSNFDEFNKLQNSELIIERSVGSCCFVGGDPLRYPCIAIVDYSDDSNGPYQIIFKFIYE